MNAAQQTEDKREKIQVLSLAKECYSMKLDLLTNATVVDDAIRFVRGNNYENRKKDDDNTVNSTQEIIDWQHNPSKQHAMNNNGTTITNEVF